MVDWPGVWDIYRESIAVLVVSLGGGIFAGSVMGTDAMVAQFEDVPGLLLLLPAFLATRGNVYGALGARISSGLHQGMIEPRLQRDRRLVAAVVASFINGVGISIFVGGFAWFVLLVQPNRSPAPLAHLVAVTFVAGLLTSLALIFGILVVIFAGFKRGLNPDNVIGPIVTTLGDVFGVLFLYTSIVAVGVVL